MVGGGGGEEREAAVRVYGRPAKCGKTLTCPRRPPPSRSIPTTSSAALSRRFMAAVVVQRGGCGSGAVRVWGDLRSGVAAGGEEWAAEGCARCAAGDEALDDSLSGREFCQRVRLARWGGAQE